MPRNGSGLYSLPEAPFVPNTAILSAEINSDFDDIADALTDSVASDGQTPITGALLAFAGSLAAPGLSWAVDPDTGRWRSGANEMQDVIGGALVVKYTASGIEITGTLACSGVLTAATGIVITSGGLTVTAGAVSLPAGAIPAAALAADSVTTVKILNANVTYAKIQNVAAVSLLGNPTGGALAPSEITLAAGLSFTGTTLVNGASQYKISAVTAAASASVAFTTGIDATYRKYVFELDNVLPATDNGQLIVEVSVDAGANWKTAAYLCSNFTTTDTGGTAVNASTAAIVITPPGVVGNAAGYGYCGTLELWTPSNSTTRKRITHKGISPRTGGTAMDNNYGSGYWNGGNDAINAIRFRFAAGNVTSGIITMYGIKG